MTVLPRARRCAGQSRETCGAQHTASVLGVFGDREHTMKLAKKEKKSVGQCHIRAKSLSSEVKDCIQISAPLGDFGK